MAPLRYSAEFDPFLSLDCGPMPSTLAQSKESKGSNFAIWQPWTQGLRHFGIRDCVAPRELPGAHSAQHHFNVHHLRPLYPSDSGLCPAHHLSDDRPGGRRATLYRRTGSVLSRALPGPRLCHSDHAHYHNHHYVQLQSWSSRLYSIGHLSDDLSCPSCANL